jgi:hypothetical protein
MRRRRRRENALDRRSSMLLSTAMAAVYALARGWGDAIATIARRREST